MMTEHAVEVLPDFEAPLRGEVPVVNDVVFLVEEPDTGLRHMFAVRLPASIGSDEQAGICVARDFLRPIHGFFGAGKAGVSFWSTEAQGDTTIDGRAVTPGESVSFGERSRLMVGHRVRITMLPASAGQVLGSPSNPFAIPLAHKKGLGGATATDHLHEGDEPPGDGLTPSPETLAAQESDGLIGADGHLQAPLAPGDEHHIPKGSRLGRYQIEKVIFDGGMGTVYEAKDPVTRRRVAIKTLAPDLIANPEAHERLINEAGAAAGLDSAHIVNVLDVAIDDNGNPYIVMELLKGVDLGERLASVGRLPPAQSAKMMCEVLKGLAAAHRAGIIHRDIKPKNIHCSETSEGEVTKILDFGVARRTKSRDPKLTANGAIVGTSYYMSPEQAKGEDLDSRCDIFSAGVVLFECLSGRRPFEGNSSVAILAKILAGDCPRLSELVPNINPALEEVVHKAMSVRREDRYSTVEEMGAALARFAPDEHREILSMHFSAPRPRLEEPSSLQFEARASRFLRPAPTDIRVRSPLRGASPGARSPGQGALIAARSLPATETPHVPAESANRRDSAPQQPRRASARLSPAVRDESLAPTSVGPSERDVKGSGPAGEVLHREEPPTPSPSPPLVPTARPGSTRTMLRMQTPEPSSSSAPDRPSEPFPGEAQRSTSSRRIGKVAPAQRAAPVRATERRQAVFVGGIALFVGLIGSFAFLSFRNGQGRTSDRGLAASVTPPEPTTPERTTRTAAPVAVIAATPAPAALEIPTEVRRIPSVPVPVGPKERPRADVAETPSGAGAQRPFKPVRRHQKSRHSKPDEPNPKIEYGKNQVPLI